MAAAVQEGETIGDRMLATLDRWTDGPRFLLDHRRVDPAGLRARMAGALAPGGSLCEQLEALIEAGAAPDWVSGGLCPALLSDLVGGDLEQVPAVSEAKSEKYRRRMRETLRAMDEDGSVGVVRERLVELIAASERFSRIESRRPRAGSPGTPRRASTAVASKLDASLRDVGVRDPAALVLPVLRELFPSESFDRESLRQRLKALRKRTAKG